MCWIVYFNQSGCKKAVPVGPGHPSIFDVEGVGTQIEFDLGRWETMYAKPDGTNPLSFDYVLKKISATIENDVCDFRVKDEIG